LPQFDVNAARQAGASDDQILSYLAQRSPGFDIQGALKQASKQDVISYLSTHAAPPGSDGGRDSLNPPPAAGPHVTMHEANLLTGKPNPSFDNAPAGATGDLAQAGLGMLKGALQVTTPGIATSFLNAKAPGVASKLPALMRDNATPAEQLPGQIITTGLMGMEGGLGEADVPPGAPRPAPPVSAVPKEALGLIRKAALKFALKKVPGYHAANDIAEFAKDVVRLTDALGAKEATPAQAIPQTEGTPWGKPILKPAEPAQAAPAVDATAPARTALERGPQPIAGESALNQILTAQDNANLLKIAKSRGINVTKEALLKPGTADKLLVKKIIDDFSPEELQDISAQYLENTRFKHNFGDIGPEAWQTLSLQSYFPEMKIPAAQLKRMQEAIQRSKSVNLSTLIGR
jgi:hypothetical protein